MNDFKKENKMNACSNIDYSRTMKDTHAKIKLQHAYIIYTFFSSSSPSADFKGENDVI